MNRIKLIRTFLILALLGPISSKLVRGDELHPFRPTWLPNFSLGGEANPLPWDPISEEGLNKCLTISGILVVDAWNKNLISGPTAQETLKIARLNVLQALYPPPNNEFQLQKNLQGAEKSAKSLSEKFKKIQYIVFPLSGSQLGSYDFDKKGFHLNGNVFIKGLEGESANVFLPIEPKKAEKWRNENGGLHVIAKITPYPNRETIVSEEGKIHIEPAYYQFGSNKSRLIASISASEKTPENSSPSLSSNSVTPSASSSVSTNKASSLASPNSFPDLTIQGTSLTNPLNLSLDEEQGHVNKTTLALLSIASYQVLEQRIKEGKATEVEKVSEVVYKNLSDNDKMAIRPLVWGNGGDEFERHKQIQDTEEKIQPLLDSIKNIKYVSYLIMPSMVGYNFDYHGFFAGGNNIFQNVIPQRIIDHSGRVLIPVPENQAEQWKDKEGPIRVVCEVQLNPAFQLLVDPEGSLQVKRIRYEFLDDNNNILFEVDHLRTKTAYLLENEAVIKAASPSSPPSALTNVNTPEGIEAATQHPASQAATNLEHTNSRVLDAAYLGLWHGDGRLLISGNYTIDLQINSDTTFSGSINTQTESTELTLPSRNKITFKGSWRRNENNIDLMLSEGKWFNTTKAVRLTDGWLPAEADACQGSVFFKKDEATFTLVDGKLSPVPIGRRLNIWSRDRNNEAQLPSSLAAAAVAVLNHNAKDNLQVELLNVVMTRNTEK